MNRNQSSLVSADLFIFAGTVLVAVWLLAFVGWQTEHVWEDHHTVTRQWLAVGLILFPYIVYAALPAWFLDTLRRHIGNKLLVATQWMSARIPIQIRNNSAHFGASLISIVYTVFGFDLAKDKWANCRLALQLTLIFVLLVTTAWLVIDGHRHVALLFGLAQAAAIIRFSAGYSTSLPSRLWICLASIVAWTFASGFTFTPLSQFVLGAVPATGLATVAISASFALVLAELLLSGQPARPACRRTSLLVMCLAIACFCELGLRTDNLLTDWIPYHRSYWVGPADFVRVGGWLLWNVPSQYGFLSALSIAVWPAASTWQALFEQTSLALGVDALVLFFLLRFRRSGTINAAFAIVVCAATVYSSQGARFPFGWRLYPQLGLRFTGMLGLLGIVFVAYLWRHQFRLRFLAYVAGYAVWTLSILWSFESGVLATFVWAPFVLLDLAADVKVCDSPVRYNLVLGCARLAPFVLIPLAVVAVLQIVYQNALGHGPDYAGYFEFSAAYQRQDLPLPPLQARGPVWLLVILLIAVGSVAVRTIRMRRFASAPVVFACWFGLWGVCSYYIGEGFTNHVNAMVPIFAVVIGVLLALQRTESVELVSIPVKALFAPVLVLTVASAIGTPEQFSTIRGPGLPGFNFDSTAQFPATNGEFRDLLARAKVRSTELVIYPISTYNVKISLGLTLPFTRTADGRSVQQFAWLPLSPVGPYNVLMTLPFERRLVYLQRYYAQVRHTGWLISYHEPVDCSRLLPGLRTTDIQRSVNYQIGRCLAARTHG